jgi:hypothetical protein
VSGELGIGIEIGDFSRPNLGRRSETESRVRFLTGQNYIRRVLMGQRGVRPNSFCTNLRRGEQYKKN